MSNDELLCFLCTKTSKSPGVLPLTEEEEACIQYGNVGAVVVECGLVVPEE